MFTQLHGLELAKKEAELFRSHSGCHENESTHDAHFESFMLLGSNVPHLLEFALSKLSMFVEKV